ncbi:hypothetical protein FH589_13635 [Leptospira interrogans]|uniref:hypothetical protein n=1 Tax=Leptospira interrogans TaxID=173 RepID=UPI0010C0BEC0|nr:hypothetical protein [Leptospira interrogans]KAA1263385.1 hypothetical protein C5473_21935 [Leptospira interrogans serovar Weerasinghe]KAA1293380.1 hypothetical protein C4X99_02745 [Leptospira interrogans serovar Geyaweera]KAA1263593.1 hypothetical protein C5473_21165 [Leptospira interrogans serovar Weerasinghe]QCO36874.1 hypothetical protein E4412_06375 [Leptospira interrogans]QCO41614.1 hypothetical protein E4413_12335 [Leptospira interrogans]
MLSQTQRLTLDRSTDRVRDSVERFLKLSVSLYMDRSTDRVRNSAERFLWIAFYIKTKEE